MKVLVFGSLLAVLAIVGPFLGRVGRDRGESPAAAREPGSTRLAIQALQALPKEKFSKLKDGMTEAEVEAILGKEGGKWVVKIRGPYKGLLCKHWTFPGQNDVVVWFKEGKVQIKRLDLFQPQSTASKPARPPVPPPTPSPQKRN